MQVVLQVLQEVSPKAIPQVRVWTVPRISALMRVGDRGVARPGLVLHKAGVVETNERSKSKRRAQ